jgi:hypothetical protein
VRRGIIQTPSLAVGADRLNCTYETEKRGRGVHATDSDKTLSKYQNAKYCHPETGYLTPPRRVAEPPACPERNNYRGPVEHAEQAKVY